MVSHKKSETTNNIPLSNSEKTNKILLTKLRKHITDIEWERFWLDRGYRLEVVEKTQSIIESVII